MRLFVPIYRARVQHVDRVADVQALAEPKGRRCPRVQGKTLSIIQRPQSLHRVTRYPGRRRNVRKHVSVGIAELKLATRLSIDLVTLLVHGAVMPPAEHGEIRERRRPALSPVPDVMTLPNADSTTREAAATVSVV